MRTSRFGDDAAAFAIQRVYQRVAMAGTTILTQRFYWALICVLGFAGVLLWPHFAGAGDLSARDVAVQLHGADEAKPIDLSARDLSNLDLAGLDFKSANLNRSNLYGADLSSAKLTGANLSGVRLDRAIVSKADFSRANLEGASVLRPSAYNTLDFSPSETPKFAGANLKGALLIARLDGADFRGANLSGATIGPLNAADDTLVTRSSMMVAPDFTGADLSGALVRFVDFSYGRFPGANLAHATFLSANLVNADLSNANLTGANVTNTNFEGTNLRGVKGLDTVIGLDTARNLDKALR